MKYIFFAVIAWCVSVSVQAREKRDLLTSTYSEQFVQNALVQDNSWIKYPKYKDRLAWQSVSESLRAKYIKNGERYIGYDWPSVRATEYLEFSRSGDRGIMERPQNERRAALQALVMAELMEGKGRFMDDIINGVFLFCEQTYWGASAHFYMYKEGESPGTEGSPTTNLPDIENPIVDLVVGEIAADLAWVWYYFHEEFDRISPVVARRLKSEIKDKVLNPFYERDDYWWITGWKRGAVNNWTPWCNFNVLNCIMLIEDDPVKKTKAIYKTMASVDLFFNSYPDDGACDEGPSYWGVAGCKAFDYLNFLNVATGNKISIFDHPLVKDIGRYIYRVYISQGCYFTNFADASPIIHPRGGAIFRYGKEIGDETMKAFGAFLLRDRQYGEEPVTGSIGLILEDMFQMEGWQQTQASEPLIADFYFPDTQIAVARDQAGSNKGFYFAAKGGHNGEAHNHNDVGSCIVFYNANPVLIDLGVGEYTRQTFSNERYQIWYLQSLYHNVPAINGMAQPPGGQYKAANSAFKASPSKVSFQTDLAAAYPAEAKVDKWIRNITLERGKRIRISEKFQLSEIAGKTELRYVTPLQCAIVKPGVLSLAGDGFELLITYKPAVLKARIEQKEIDSRSLRNIWGEKVSIIIFEIPDVKSGDVSIEIINSK